MSILKIPDVLTQDEARRCREALEKALWLDGRETAGHVAVRAKDNQQLAEDDPLGVQLGNSILDRLGHTAQFIAAALPLKVLPPRFNRYAGGGTYSDHIDNAVFSVPGTPHRIRSDLSATLFLSEPDAYDGGDLMIEGEGDGIKLPAGHLVLYPAGSLHRVTPVTRGVRFASFFWVQSLVREDSRRSLLLDLDGAVQALAKKLPDDPEVTRLTGIYHNLLRHWAET